MPAAYWVRGFADVRLPRHPAGRPQRNEGFHRPGRGAGRAKAWVWDDPCWIHHSFRCLRFHILTALRRRPDKRTKKHSPPPEGRGLCSVTFHRNDAKTGWRRCCRCRPWQAAQSFLKNTSLPLYGVPGTMSRGKFQAVRQRERASNPAHQVGKDGPYCSRERVPNQEEADDFWRCNGGRSVVK